MQLFSRFIMMDLIFHPTLSLSCGNSSNLNGVRRKFGRMHLLCNQLFSIEPLVSASFAHSLEVITRLWKSAIKLLSISYLTLLTVWKQQRESVGKNKKSQSFCCQNLLSSSSFNLPNKYKTMKQCQEKILLCLGICNTFYSALDFSSI